MRITYKEILDALTRTKSENRSWLDPNSASWKRGFDAICLNKRFVTSKSNIKYSDFDEIDKLHLIAYAIAPNDMKIDALRWDLAGDTKDKEALIQFVDQNMGVPQHIVTKKQNPMELMKPPTTEGNMKPTGNLVTKTYNLTAISAELIKIGQDDSNVENHSKIQAIQECLGINPEEECKLNRGGMGKTRTQNKIGALMNPDMVTKIATILWPDKRLQREPQEKNAGGQEMPLDNAISAVTVCLVTTCRTELDDISNKQLFQP